MGDRVDQDIDTNVRPTGVPNHGLTFFVVKASPTSTVNSLKGLMLIEELGVPYSVYVVGSPGKETWFQREINPCGMIPALEDFIDDTKTKRAPVWESTSCLQFLADRYDPSRQFSGSTLAERATINNWLAHHTAGLGASAKWYLWFKTLHPEEIGSALDKLLENIRTQYRILDAQLARPGQNYIALADRATVADFVNLPFANDKIAATANMDFADWPHLQAWSRKMMERPAVQRAMMQVMTFGVEKVK